MKTHSRIQMMDGSFITRPHGCAKWVAVAAPGKSIPNCMANDTAAAQNKAVADWMAKSAEDYKNRMRKKRCTGGEK